MTSPRDALRALVDKARKLAGKCSRSTCARYEIGALADELAAILSQMDSEPTVAQWREAVQWIDWHPRPENKDQWLDRIEQRARDLAAKDKQP